MKSTITIPKILLPRKGVDMNKWSVIACDQFTSQPSYWKKVDELVGDAPSTLRIIYPEVYLEQSDKEKRIKAINEQMLKYLQGDIFEEFEGFILVERIDSVGEKRLGLVIAVDLEEYEYTEKNAALIKATEKTVVDRLPPRIEVRKGACLECPHIMMLMDDKDKSIIEGLYERREELELAYDFELNLGGGHVRGYKVKHCNGIIDSINSLLSDDKPILFAVGDGNHSLATAKECWNNIKKTLSGKELASHPARYALCELVNLHDNSLVFEPIHRAVFGVGQDFVEYMASELARLGGKSKVKVVYAEKEYSWTVSNNPSDAIADIQRLMDEYAANHSGMIIDYIHGDNHLLNVAREKDAVAVFMPCLAKDGLFDYVVRRGVLPRKSFSMGHAEDKRYYLECRKISEY